MEASSDSGLAGIRWQLLCALHDLAAGGILIVQDDPDTAEPRVVVFDGQPLPQLAGAALIRRQWVQPKRAHWLLHSAYYGLSQGGADALEAGLRWWRSLSYMDRFWVRLTE